jgi:reverse gyrase
MYVFQNNNHSAFQVKLTDLIAVILHKSIYAFEKDYLQVFFYLDISFKRKMYHNNVASSLQRKSISGSLNVTPKIQEPLFGKQCI